MNSAACSTPIAPLTPPGEKHQGQVAPFYMPMPQLLLADLRDSPLAIGVYALIARLLRVTGEPVPLSPADIRRYDPTVSYGAATRALQRLDDAGFVVARRAPGRKTAYLPAWGRVAGRVVPWDLAAPLLGRPRHRPVVRLDQRLLDLCMGRLQPHHTHPALVTRYLTAPLLGLGDVGAYALALCGLPAAAPRLAALGLLADGAPRPLPDDATVLAVASQQALAGAASEPVLTPAGWALVGLTPAPAPQPEGEALFFVPAGMIGGSITPVIASPIAGGAEARTPSGAPASAPTTQPAATAGSHGAQGEERTTTNAGGGDLIAQAGRPEPSARQADQPAEAQAGTQTASERLLRAAGVRTDIAAALADRPAERVRDVLAQARGRKDVRSVAAWAVSVLRAPPAAEAAPPPKVSEKAILFHPRLSGYDRQRWLGLFRSADPAERPAVLARFHASHPPEERDAALA